MRARVTGVTSALPFNARDTVATETFASRATSLIVTTTRFPLRPDFTRRAESPGAPVRPKCKRFHSRMQTFSVLGTCHLPGAGGRWRSGCASGPGALLQHRHGRQRLAFEEFQERAAAGRDVGDLVFDAVLVDGGQGVAAARDRERL